MAIAWCYLSPVGVNPGADGIQERLGDKLLFIVRNPLRAIHPHAEHAAETAESAAANGNFWEMHDLLYEQPEQPGR
jgi:hypothetical protein